MNLKLHETFINEQGMEETFDTSITTDVTYDAVQNRIFRVENTGRHPIYVRLSFLLEGEDSEGESFETKQYINVEAENDNWEYRDGWYYYKAVLEPDTTTKELITDVIFDINEITANYPGSNYELHVSAQGVQSENNTSSALQAVGWPED